MLRLNSRRQLNIFNTFLFTIIVKIFLIGKFNLSNFSIISLNVFYSFCIITDTWLYCLWVITKLVGKGIVEVHFQRLIFNPKIFSIYSYNYI